MKYFILFSLLVLRSLSLPAQQLKNIEIPVTGNDTSYWYKQTAVLAAGMKLQNLQMATDSLYFRIWNMGAYQVADIRINNHSVNGTITCFAIQYGKAFEVKKVFFKTGNLDKEVSELVLKAYSSQQVENIPSEEKIKGWRNGFDGIQYLVEIATPENYAFRTYWSPHLFSDSLPEAKRIESFTEYLFHTLNVGSYIRSFNPPKGAHSSGGGVPGINISVQFSLSPGARTFVDML